jgi:superfamily II DNA/RNA helicase
MYAGVSRQISTSQALAEAKESAPWGGTTVNRMVNQTATKATAHPASLLGRNDRKPHSDLRFSDMNGLCSESKHALAAHFQFEFATEVQKMTMAPALEGRDLLARARTGTGKTLGFLLPMIERIRHQGTERGNIRALVVAPARELACQIAEEAKTVLRDHRGLGVQVVVGGSNRNTEAYNLNSKSCTILVCTPGRYLDHYMNTPGFPEKVKAVSVLVLDECDRLLDMGFRKDIKRILDGLPAPSKRQTFLFSATLPPLLNDIAEVALRQDFKYVDCVGDEAPETAESADQAYVSVPKDEWLFRLAQVCSFANFALFCRLQAVLHPAGNLCLVG